MAAIHSCGRLATQQATRIMPITSLGGRTILCKRSWIRPAIFRRIAPSMVSKCSRLRKWMRARNSRRLTRISMGGYRCFQVDFRQSMDRLRNRWVSSEMGNRGMNHFFSFVEALTICHVPDSVVLFRFRWPTPLSDKGNLIWKHLWICLTSLSCNNFFGPDLCR